DLVSLPTELNSEKFDSRFRLVIAIAKRARDLYHGAMPKIASKSKRITTVALEEVMSGSVSVL
ncbi:MAG: DNA-directed RNA polymerase subunit omega, partial [Nitrospiraceae bacterium]